MKNEIDNRETATEELAVIIRQRTFNLMSTGRMMCSEAVLSVLNQGLGGGLPPDVAMKVASGFPEGIGSSGCTCGGWAAEHAARMILTERPELVPMANEAFLHRKDSRIVEMIKKILPGFLALFYHK